MIVIRDLQCLFHGCRASTHLAGLQGYTILFDVNANTPAEGNLWYRNFRVAFALGRPRDKEAPGNHTGTTESLLSSPTKGLQRARQWCPRITPAGPAQDHVGMFMGMLMPAMQTQTLHKATASTCTSQSSGFQRKCSFQLNTAQTQ